jgi:chromosome segregation ATPase
MNSEAEGTGTEPRQADPRAGPRPADPFLDKRATQVERLTAAVERLKTETRRLRRGLPADVQHPHDLWVSGLVAIKAHLEEIAEWHEDCELLVKQMSEARQVGDAGETKDAEQMELRALSEELTQLDEAISQVASVTRKAIAAVQGARSTDDKRENAYFAAVGELADLVGHFEALISQLRGEAGLPGPPGAVPRSLSTIRPQNWTYRTLIRIMVV